MSEEKQSSENKPEEVKKATNKSKSVTLKINGNVITIVVLVVLLFISVTQAFALGNLKEKISTGEVQAATTSTSSSSGSSATPANLQDLPSMVGGC